MTMCYVKAATRVTHIPTGESITIADNYYHRSHTKRAIIAKEALINRVAYLKDHSRSTEEIFVYDLADVSEEEELLDHRIRNI